MEFKDENEKALLINGKANSPERLSSDPESDELPTVTTTSGSNSSGKTTGTFGAVFIVVNAAMGAGLLNIPDGFKNAGGIAPGIIVEMVSQCLCSFFFFCV